MGTEGKGLCARACVFLIHALLYLLPVRDKRFKSLENCGATRWKGLGSLNHYVEEKPTPPLPPLTTHRNYYWVETLKLTFLFAGVIIPLGCVRGHRERQLWLDGTFHMVPKIYSLA